MASSTNFAANELVRALAEQTFGIESFEIKEGNVTEHEATAEVQLLEGTTVEISLTSRGYQVCNYPPLRTKADYPSHSSLREIQQCMRLSRMLYRQLVLGIQRPNTRSSSPNCLYLLMLSSSTDYHPSRPLSL